MKTISVIKYTFIALGLAMLLGAFSVYQNTQEFLRNALTAGGSVTELVASRPNDSNGSITYSPIVEFQASDGRYYEIESSSGSNPPSYYEGEYVEVLYEEDSPYEAKINSFFSVWGMSVILGALGGVFFLIGFSITLFGQLAGRKVKYLKEHGISVEAKFESVVINSSLVVNGKSPYKIHVQWLNPTTSQLHIFKSANIWFDPTNYITQDKIVVLMEKDNPKKYHVDTSFLPKLSK